MNNGAVNLHQLFDLVADGGDAYVGDGLEYPWGGLYGGHIVAQALRAASFTAADDMVPHSTRAYFIRRGDNKQPVRYEVDRIRNGKSFTARRVVARQDDVAIRNLEASFPRHEESMDVTTVEPQRHLPSPETIDESSWSTFLHISLMICDSKVSFAQSPNYRKHLTRDVVSPPVLTTRCGFIARFVPMSGTSTKCPATPSWVVVG